MLAAVLSLGTMTAFAQEEVQEVTTEATEVAADATEAIEATATEVVEATEAMTTQDGFNEVALEEVPEAISKALETAHPGATISKAYVNEESQYKLEVAQEDGTEVELYADSEGNWIEM